MNDSTSTYAVIMAGGSGTRFWPASLVDRPKQFLPISGDRPMLTETFARLEGLVPPERVLVVTAESQAQLVRECLPELPPENLLAEPLARNTAPCIALAAFEVQRRDPGAVQIVLAADHVIEPAESFRATLSAAAAEAAKGEHLITLGVSPTFPATGYGYIRAGEEVGTSQDHTVYEVSRFVEKPDRASADSFVKSGRFYWNSGIFVWRTSTILDAYERFLPEVHGGLKDVGPADPGLPTAYAELPKVPVDKAILEQASNVLMLPIDYRWNDVGSWAALTGVVEKDADGNWPAVSDGAQLLSEESSGCIAYAEGEHLIALLGVDDLVVVRTANATLVAPRDRAEDVKRLVERLREEGPDYL
ncbi:MAG: mannose-1-phosphate guanylyltransferase [Planctomycetota bacterium]